MCSVAQTTGYRYADSPSHGELLLMDMTHVATRADLFGHHQATGAGIEAIVAADHPPSLVMLKILPGANKGHGLAVSDMKDLLGIILKSRSNLSWMCVLDLIICIAVLLMCLANASGMIACFFLQDGHPGVYNQISCA